MKYLGIFLVALAAKSYSVVECERPIEKIWTGDDPHKLYVVHGDSYAPSGMRLEDVGDNEIINRTLSILLAAHISGKRSVFRYANGSSCTPTSAQQIIGVWIE